MMLLVTLALMGALGGCTTPDSPAGADGGVQRDHCTLKVSACINSCYEADMGWACRRCCNNNGDSCDVGGDYSFSSCLNLE
ncbi:hypothetical protein [Polyangium sp. 6x1]|uniref:hypothetical protein n=1 Tax=Polyangium sp. 6x1 TaxID=3042689 RepID=UPI002482B545|nr:hypothetical protein [Polyangium sp. 6x1]MDI1447369.1 hypothetical protein [Polyangium sp. 6x1]